MSVAAKGDQFCVVRQGESASLDRESSRSGDCPRGLMRSRLGWACPCGATEPWGSRSQGRSRRWRASVPSITRSAATGDLRVRAQPLGEHHPALRVDPDHFAERHIGICPLSRHGRQKRRVHRADDATDPGGPRRAASRHPPMPGRLEVQPRQPTDPRLKREHLAGARRLLRPGTRISSTPAQWGWTRALPGGTSSVVTRPSCAGLLSEHKRVAVDGSERAHRN